VKALVTGASGFIGRRLVEALRQSGDSVHTLVRSTHGRGCQETPGVTHFIGDVTAPESLTEAAKGCDVGFHCVHGGTNLAEAARINVRGTLNVLMAARNARVGRVVHLSTWRVHGRRLPSLVHEALPLVTRGDWYDVSKAEAERAAIEFAARHGIELVVLRPTLVYGPGSGPWVEALVDRLKYEQLCLIGGGTGVANVVSVDDLVEAMQLAAQKPGAAGQAFLISGASPPPLWRDYIDALCSLLGRELPSSVPGWAARTLAAAYQWRYRFTRRPPRLTAVDVGLFWEHCVVQIEKAETLLGYAPRVDLAMGMRAVGEFLEAEGRVGTYEKTIALADQARAAQRLHLGPQGHAARSAQQQV